MSLNKKIIIGISIIFLIVAASYLLENASKERGLSAGKVIKVLDNNELAAYMGVDVIRYLNEQEFPGAPDSKGPTLLYVMGAAGISEFNQVEIKGLGDGAVFRAGKDEVNRDYILCVTNQGTVNLINKNNYRYILVENVSEINKIN
ncbi:MAG: hypothetical protein PHS52_05860 [Desulfotomaculaceae bacterium]|nr:hypothetical protein [Desulfotomaculaceae bacterium]